MEQEELLKEYLAYCRLRGTSGQGVRSVKYNIGLFFDYCKRCSLDIDRITLKEAEDFQGYMGLRMQKKDDSKGYDAQTIQIAVSKVMQFYRYLKERGRVIENPFAYVLVLKKVKKLPKNIPEEETLKKILAEMRNFNKGKDLLARKKRYKSHVLAEVMYSTGCRINEAAGIRLADVDFMRNEITITDTKAKRSRRVFLGEYASKVLFIYVRDFREHFGGKELRESGMLFSGRVNVVHSLNESLHEACKSVGEKPISSHYLRHAVGTHLLKNGCDLRSIQDILGHSRISSTQVYTRVNKNDLRGILDRYHPRKRS